jgi:hypothetical protein
VDVVERDCLFVDHLVMHMMEFDVDVLCACLNDSGFNQFKSALIISKDLNWRLITYDFRSKSAEPNSFSCRIRASDILRFQ